MYILLLLTLLLHLTNAASRTKAPPGAIVVAKSGGNFTKIQDAVNALDTKSTTPKVIFIEPETYNEQVYIPALKSPLTIYGSTKESLSYASNTVTITHNFSQATHTGGNDGIATLRAWTPNLKIYNLNIVNTYGKGSQAVALSAQATNQGFYGCQLHGYQDTLLTNTGTQLYAKCQITGVTDFIFGQRASSWFEGCDIRVLSANLGYITANGRNSASETSFFVINNSTVDAASGNKVPDGAFYLGRPWRSYAQVVFQRCRLGKVVSGEGWRVWGTTEPNTEHVFFGEWGNTGEGSKGKRVGFATMMAGPVGIERILGVGWANATWVDRAYL